jgi:CRISPR/Cas system CMR subunit Cmr6 (Cas7 group RAMP superfamily)
MTSLQANNLSKDLRRLHWSIEGSGGVAPQNKDTPIAISFLNIHYAVDYETVVQAIEDNVPPFEVGRCRRLNRDQIPMANGGMHACSRGSKTHSAAKAQQLSTEVNKMTKTRQ